MATFKALLDLVLAYQAVLLPILSGLIGLLLPSPFQRAIKDEAKTHEDEAKASASRGDVGDLDHLP